MSNQHTLSVLELSFFCLDLLYVLRQLITRLCRQQILDSKCSSRANYFPLSSDQSLLSLIKFLITTNMCLTMPRLAHRCRNIKQTHRQAGVRLDIIQRGKVKVCFINVSYNSFHFFLSLYLAITFIIFLFNWEISIPVLLFMIRNIRII